MLCKAPNDNYSYSVDWSNELGVDTINGSTWTLESGITNDGDSYTDSVSTIDLSGGTLGKAYEMTNNITTAGGDIYEKKLYIKVQDQLVG